MLTGLVWLPWAIMAGFLAVFLARPINPVTADIGRHITNGELLLGGVTRVLTENFYSFTEPTHPFVNHHWGAGVLFHWVYSALGYSGLSVLNIGLMMGAIWLLVTASSNHKDRNLFLIPIFLLAPLLAYRTEVRPEGFSYLFLAIFYYVIAKWRNGLIKTTYAAGLLAVVQLIWVNTHIYFVFGLATVAAFGIEALVSGNKAQAKQFFMLMGLLTAVSMINPFLLNGLLAPFLIFKEYGYRVAENQSVFFMYDRFGNPHYLHFLALVLLLPLLVFFLWRWQHWKNNLALILITTAFAVLGMKAVRGITLFVLMDIVLLGVVLASWAARQRESVSSMIQKFATGGAMALALALLLVSDVYFAPRLTYAANEKGRTVKRHINGLGAYPGTDAAARFFIDQKLSGPIFNNYDIGGYLIQHLHNREKVFVDNRPEAYSVAFFDSIYGPMQRDEAVWQAMLLKYNFNTIFFYRLDETEHAQPFLIRRMQDPEWVPVFVDAQTIIVVRNTASNAQVIERFGISREVFSGRPN